MESSLLHKQNSALVLMTLCAFQYVFPYVEHSFPIYHANNRFLWSPAQRSSQDTGTDKECSPGALLKHNDQKTPVFTPCTSWDNKNEWNLLSLLWAFPAKQAQKALWQFSHPWSFFLLIPCCLWEKTARKQFCLNTVSGVRWSWNIYKCQPVTKEPNKSNPNAVTVQKELFLLCCIGNIAL